MRIAANSWHAKVFIWWYRQKYYGSTPTAYNLCPYVRVILFWALPRFLLISCKWLSIASWLVISAIGELLFYRALGMAGLKAEGLVPLILAAAVLFIALLFLTVKVTITGKQQKAVRSFARVLVARAEAFHDRICPIVRFE